MIEWYAEVFRKGNDMKYQDDPNLATVLII